MEQGGIYEGGIYEGGIYEGVDVAKARVDVAIRPEGDRCVVSSDDTGIAALVVQLQEFNPAAVDLEASGGRELPLVAALAAAALPVVVVNPRQVRDFAQATGHLAKTDALDAAVLAHCAEAVRPPLRPLRDAETQDLNSLVARRQQVMTRRFRRAVQLVRDDREVELVLEGTAYRPRVGGNRTAHLRALRDAVAQEVNVAMDIGPGTMPLPLMSEA